MMTAMALLPSAAAAQADSTQLTGNAFVDQVIQIGANKDFTRAQSTAAVTVIQSKDVNNRSAKNIGNSILGQGGNGLVSLQGAGTYYAANPTFYVRGLQSLSTSTPLILVDGIERDISFIDPTEVDHVTILKDAAAVALYGYKGANGAIAIYTKRGKYNSREVKVTYDHLFNYQINRPKFVDAATYATAMNQALANEGSAARYSAAEIEAFRSGQYPDLYPNVNWVDETYRHHGMTDKIAAEFTGGGEKFRYYTMVNLLTDNGFINQSKDDNGNVTQDKYVRANMRVNLDIDLTPTTDLKVNTVGMLSEMRQPGSQANLWNMIYTVPSAAFPVKFANGDWGGSSTWAGTNNPVANTAGAAYYKIHERALYADLTIDQDLSGFVKGLGATARLGYDTYSTIYEDHSKTFVYGYYSPATWVDGVPSPGTYTEGGEAGEQGTGANTNSYSRRLHFDVGLNYDRAFGDHYVYSSLRWEYEYLNTTGVNTSIYRQNFAWTGHYAYKNRYIAEVSLVESGSSRLAPDTKWAFSPTVSAAWVISKESWMEDVKWINFLKLRASYGRINADYLPGDNVWTYYTQSYATDGVTYPFNSGFDSDFGRTTIGQMATTNPSHEKADKYNIGIDATLFGGLNLQFDAYYQKRFDIWVDGAGAYGSVIGFDAPYINQGKVKSWGFEAAADYSHKFGEVELNVGAAFALNKNEILDQAEAAQPYANLVTTGYPLNSIWGLKAIGLFQSQEEINNSPTQSFSTVRPGDIKYEDINGDGVIDSNDRTKIGHSTTCPELTYSFHLGLEWRGLGFDCMFQGVGRYSAVLNTSGYYWGLINNTNLSQYVYENSWTAENPDAIFPRLSSNSNANNYQTSTFWLRDRSYLKLRNVEVYYRFPESLLSHTGFINGAKIYVRGTDLFTIDNIDEADAGSYGITSPLTRSIIAGLSLTF